MPIPLYYNPLALPAPPEQPPPWPTTARGWAECLLHPVVGVLQAGGWVWLAYLGIKYGLIALLLVAALVSWLVD